VLVTGTLPPFARAGGRIDVTVSTIGDADSLLGGTLIMTPLNAADGQIYAVAQGSVIAGGATAGGDAATVTQGVPTSGRSRPGRGSSARSRSPSTISRSVRLACASPISPPPRGSNRRCSGTLGPGTARMLDSGTVQLNLAALGA
jgi:flagellar P-ring protein precursor FlgI